MENNFFSFHSSPFHLLPKEMKQENRFLDYIRLFIRSFRGYAVYYLMKDNDLAAYCFLKRNYLGKYAFLQREDGLVNPYFVNPQYRGGGLGKALLKETASKTKCRKIWAVVKAENIPSIRALEGTGFQRKGYSQKGVWAHRLTDKETSLIVFCKEKED